MTGGHRLRGEHGVTLVELLTVMAIAGVVLAFVTGTVVQATRAQRVQTARVSALNESKVAFERVTRDIRGADPLHAAEPDRIHLDVRRADGSHRTVTYERSGTSLRVRDAATGKSSDLVGNLAPGWPLFVFHLSDGTILPASAVVTPRLVRSITFQLRVEPNGAGRVVDLTNRVVLRNSRA